MKVWYPFQGAEQLSDVDFFRIAGDQAAIDATEKARQSAIKWNTRGKFAMLGGAIGLIAGVVVGATAPSVPIVAPALEIGGSLALGSGWYMAYWGARQMQPEVHAVERSQAERDALQYNANHGANVGVSMSRSF
jgi:hypothetical protein